MALTAHMVTIDCADPVRLAGFWSDAAGYRITWDQAGGEFLVLGPVAGDGVSLGLQRVPEPRAGKNRVHVDWSASDRRAEVERLRGLGARVLGEHAVPGLAWTVLADPEGNEFCVSGRE
ncbi:MAG TPA: VOC family protein [Pilimelia sp.]|nr:VOC family protein [Pilimelia sp.]